MSYNKVLLLVDVTNCFVLGIKFFNKHLDVDWDPRWVSHEEETFTEAKLNPKHECLYLCKYVAVLMVQDVRYEQTMKRVSTEQVFVNTAVG